MELIIAIAIVVIGAAVYYNRKKPTVSKPVETAPYKVPEPVEVRQPAEVSKPADDRVEATAPVKKAPARKTAAKPAAKPTTKVASKPAAKPAAKRPAAKKAPASK